MKRYHLVQIANHLNRYKKLSSIERVDETIVKLTFDKNSIYYFDMCRGDSYIFKKDEYKKSKQYNSPFDILLSKYFTNSKIIKIEVLEGDRVLRLYTESSSKYKSQGYILQFEFTGRNTNIIILNQDSIVLSAYRYVDSKVSFREVKVGVVLKPLPKREFKESRDQDRVDDIEKFLFNEYKKRESVRLKSIKQQKSLVILKKIEKLQKLYDSLDDEKRLKNESLEAQNSGSLILANLYKIGNYQREVEVTDFDGNIKTIKMPDGIRGPKEAADRFFSYAKKLKQKAKNIYIERDNLTSKIDFLKRLKSSILSAKSIDEVNLYMPKQLKQFKKRSKEDTNIESFFIEGYKISLGKSQKGNIKLLKEAKMGDIWMHIKDIPSTHVIIRNSKRLVPSTVLEFGAKLCVQFSSISAGVYLVDYTYRRNVKIKDGAHVNYVQYETIKAIKE